MAGGPSTGLKVAGCGVSTLSGTLLLLLGLSVLTLGQCTQELGRGAESNESFGFYSVFGSLLAIGGGAGTLAGWVAVVVGALALAVGAWFGVSLFRRSPSAPPPEE